MALKRDVAPAPAPEAVAAPAPEAEKNLPATTKPQGVGLANFSKAGMAMSGAKDQVILDFGTLPRLKGEQGAIVDGDGKELGKYVDVLVVSFNSRFTISPNDDDAESKLVRYSLDGKELDDGSGTLVKDYLAGLKEDWPKSACKEYYEVIGQILAWGDPSYDNLAVDDLIQLQLSPTSKKSFQAHQLNTTFKVARKVIAKERENFVRFTATKKTGGGNAWTQLNSSTSMVVPAGM